MSALISGHFFVYLSYEKRADRKYDRQEDRKVSI